MTRYNNVLALISGLNGSGKIGGFLVLSRGQSDRLRDICGEFAPRLQDWGLSIASRVSAPDALNQKPTAKSPVIAGIATCEIERFIVQPFSMAVSTGK